MVNTEFLRRIFSTERMNLKYFLKLYLGDTMFYIEDKENIFLNKKKKEVYNIKIIVGKRKEIFGYVYLNRAKDGFVLIMPKEETVIKFIFNYKNKKHQKAKVKMYKKHPEGTQFICKWGSYLKISEAYIHICC